MNYLFDPNSPDDIKTLEDLFKTPTLDRLAEKAREINKGWDLENKEPREECPLCGFNPCDCNPEPDHDTSYEAD
jgi:hypothetical protein